MTIIYFILVLSITVCVHEFGHFLFAKKQESMYMNLVLEWDQEYLNLTEK